MGNNFPVYFLIICLNNKYEQTVNNFAEVFWGPELLPISLLIYYVRLRKCFIFFETYSCYNIMTFIILEIVQ